MAGDPGLVDTRLLDDVVDLPLTVAQRFDDAAARGVGEGLEGLGLHLRVYVHQRI